ncbi:hypothetical protein [Neisseria sp. 74A18]|uniref:hypothetical protein n=1 Tax=Neisseria sp. 74A18 TaxID=1696094 RepID=UPI0006CACC11|nr:hypothetical protein [Neisseria sp. 74A18]KPN74666.1 hypothetical protein AKG43_01090 [Neisseria sp. 74A18]
MKNNEIEKITSSLNSLIEAILEKQSNFNKTFLNQRSGYDRYPCITLEDLADIPRNILNKIEHRPYEFDDHILQNIEYVAERIDESKSLLIKALDSYSYIEYLYSFIITLTWVDKFLHQSLEWENLPENTMPASLRSRLATQKRSITNLEKSSVGLNEKVKQINSAYETAKNLPIVQDDLQEAIEKVRLSSDEIDRLHQEQTSKSNKFSDQILLTENKGKERLDQIEEYKKKIEHLYNECEELKNKSAQAYSITNSNGLAGSFKERAKKLSTASNCWVAGLILSLFALWWIGSNQVEKLQSLYTSENVKNISIVLQSITALLSITAPLWFAWLSTSQIHKLFKLSEDYGFKSSVSQSYEGYRKETADISEELLKDLMNSLLRIMNDEPLRLVKDDTNATTPYSDILNQFRQKKEKDSDKEHSKSKGIISNKDNIITDEKILDEEILDDYQESS